MPDLAISSPKAAPIGATMPGFCAPQTLGVTVAQASAAAPPAAATAKPAPGPLKALRPPSLRHPGRFCDGTGSSSRLGLAIGRVARLRLDLNLKAIDTDMLPLDTAAAKLPAVLLSYSFYRYAKKAEVPKPVAISHNPKLPHFVVGHSASSNGLFSKKHRSVDVWDLRYSLLRDGISPAFSIDVASMPRSLALHGGQPFTPEGEHAPLELDIQFWDGTQVQYSLVPALR